MHSPKQHAQSPELRSLVPTLAYTDKEIESSERQLALAESIDRDMSAEELKKKLDSMARLNKKKEKKGPDWESIK